VLRVPEFVPSMRLALRKGRLEWDTEEVRRSRDQQESLLRRYCVVEEEEEEEEA